MDGADPVPGESPTGGFPDGRPVIGLPEQGRLYQMLLEWGATDEEADEAVANESMPELALELALRPPGGTVDFAEAARRAELGVPEAAALWRALGFPDPAAATTRVSVDQVDALRFLAAASPSLLSAGTTMQMARSLGAALTLIGATLVDGFRLDVEVPRRSAGDSALDVARDMHELAAETFPRFVETVDALLRRHVVQAAHGAWTTDEERTTVTHRRAVGFVDLVDYTATTHTSSPRVLADALERFEGRVSDLIGQFGGRLVKLIGDEAMFVLEDPAAACELALRLAEAFGADPEDPPVRTALGFGPTVARHGDYYGDVVNVASRLVAVARPSEVVVTESVRDAVRTGYRFEPLVPTLLRGLDEPVRAFRLAR